MNAFLSVLQSHTTENHVLRRTKLTTLQVNMGDLCNQSCSHCHIEASAQGKNIMQRKVVDDILEFLSRYKIKTLDITGGAPELNPDFDYFVTLGRRLVDELIVRSNLTVFFEPGKEYLPGFFKANKVRLICSMPCYTKESVDRQRGRGVFEKSIRALKLLNEAGFAENECLRLDLVYNPQGAYLPPSQHELEKDYKKTLHENYGIEFGRLLTITNVAIKKFKNYLETSDEYDKYSRILKDSFNPDTLGNLMCRTFLSVGYDGKLYDCDFNLALGFPIQGRNGDYIDIAHLNPDDLESKEIVTGEHCLACTAGSGSGCQGALANTGEACSLASKEEKKETVKEYYSKVLKNKDDLKTTACCPVGSMPSYLREITKMIEPEILEKFYGCGSPLPPLLNGLDVLDLGCGTGRDVYIASYLAGENGSAIGVDMTQGQLEVAGKYKESQMRRFGFKKCNIEFRKGYIEDLRASGIKDNSVDLVISNCVINLSPDKKSVFSEVFRVLRPGGELYFSDVFSGRRIPEHIKNDPVLYGECLGGALYIEDFRRLLRELGCPDYRVISKKAITISELSLQEKAAGIDFYSMTIRAFKLDGLEDICEDYGQVAVYLGTIPNNAHQFQLDDHHIFITDKPMLVCGNTASMLSKTRFGKHFKIINDRSKHFGPFPCTPEAKKNNSDDISGGGSCC